MCNSKEDISLSHTVHILSTWRGRDLASLCGIFTCCRVISNFVRTLLASFINICGNLNSCVGVVDIVFEVRIVHKLQLDVRRIFHLAFSVHGILWEHEREAFSRLLHLFYIAYTHFWITVYRLSNDLRKYVFLSYSHNPALPLSHNKPCPAPAREKMHIRESCSVDNCKKQHKDWLCSGQ